MNIVCTLRVGVELWTSLVVRLFGFMNIVCPLRVDVELSISLVVRLFWLYEYSLHAKSWRWTMNKSSSKIIVYKYSAL